VERWLAGADRYWVVCSESVRCEYADSQKIVPVQKANQNQVWLEGCAVSDDSPKWALVI